MIIKQCVQTIRFLSKHKKYSLVNILGLVIGMVCFIYISFWVQGEYSFDRFHNKSSQIFRVISFRQNEWFALTPNALSDFVVEQIPDVIKATRYKSKNFLTKYEHNFGREPIGFVDDSYFQIFSFPFIIGSPDNAFEYPFSVVITESIANKYFGEDNPIGKPIQLSY